MGNNNFLVQFFSFFFFFLFASSNKTSGKAFAVLSKKMRNNRMTNIQMITTPAVRIGYKITKLEGGVPVGA
jgi:hypothetical protein